MSGDENEEESGTEDEEEQDVKETKGEKKNFDPAPIKEDLDKLSKIKKEIKSRNLELKKLRGAAKEIEERVVEYLDSYDQPGIVHKNMVIVVEKKQKRLRKKEKEKKKDMRAVLVSYGIKNTDEAMDKIIDSMKGESEEINKLLIKVTG